jgi:hypothetical protein
MCSYPTKPFRYATRPAFCSTAFGPLKYSSITAVIGLIEEEIFLVAAFSNVDAPLSSSCLSINTIFTLMASGVGVTVNVAVADGVRVGVKEGVDVGLICCVIVGVREDVAVAVADGVKVDVLEVDVLEDEILGMGEDVIAAVVDGVKVAVFDLVAVGGALVTVDVDVDVNGSGISEGVEEIVAVAMIIKGVSLGMGV